MVFVADLKEIKHFICCKERSPQLFTQSRSSKPPTRIKFLENLLKACISSCVQFNYNVYSSKVKILATYNETHFEVFFKNLVH